MDIAIYKGKNLHEAELKFVFKPKEYRITQNNGKYKLDCDYWALPCDKIYDELIIGNGLLKLYEYGN